MDYHHNQGEDRIVAHKVFIRHTYIQKCSHKACKEEWKINEADKLEKLRCPHCGTYDVVQYVDVDQRKKYNQKWE